ncbi:MAG: hypothetical protein DRJ61_17630 [Acidobacteria bacterium]|jgi:hypothetical protein|nr:MAG: hypothetical protein DRJ61_17630 [Acidobacteriota bacterium]
MTLSDSQKKLYEDVLQQEKKQIEDLEAQIQEELAAVKLKISDLQAAQKAAHQMYDAACMRLGIPNEFEEDGAKD